MSKTELNVLDIKKILVAQDLYKAGMTLIEMEHVYYSFKCKQAIEAEGLYENGMSDQDIKDIYNTLKKSEQSADNDKEYREILNRTETNCSNIDMLIEESNAINDETVDVTSIQPVSPKPQSSQSASTPFSSFKKQIENPPMINSVNVLMEVESNHPLLKLRDKHYTNASLIYYHQTRVLKLPLKERTAAISQYLLNLHKYHRKNDANSKIEWSNPIQPEQKEPFNNDLCVDFVPDVSEDDVQEEIVDSCKSDDTEIRAKENSFIFTRSRRVVKRKIYTDQVTDDDDDFAATTKKTKSNDNLNLSSDTSPESKWLKRKKKSIPKTPVYFSQGSDRINKIFDKLKWGDSSNSKPVKKSTPQSVQETLDLSDSDEEIFPTKESLTTANINDEEQVIKNKNTKSVKAKKTSPKKRAAYNKLTVQKDSPTKENESPEISTLNFYAKNKNSEVDESNNNKLEKNEDLTNCPICNRPFPASRIEVHASNCIQYEGKDSEETYCDICNENIPDKKLPNHRYECLQKITEDSIVVDKPVTRSQRTNGFLCQVCDKYICNTSEIQHASNCIAKV